MSIKERFLIFPAILAYFYQGSYLQFVSIILSLKEIIILDCQLSRLTTIFFSCHFWLIVTSSLLHVKYTFFASQIFGYQQFFYFPATFGLFSPSISVAVHQRNILFGEHQIQNNLVVFFIRVVFLVCFFLRNTSNNALQISLKRLPS